ncbi:hypothetical protein U3516DRAFT_647250 [Neocallimastix sp. 'constans']
MYEINKTSLKVASSADTSLIDSKKYHVSQSVPLTPIEKNINQSIIEKSDYRSLLSVNKSIKKLEKLDENTNNYNNDDSDIILQSLPQKSSSVQPLRDFDTISLQQLQSEYIYTSSSTVKHIAPKLRRSYSQQLKKMSKSPRLSYIQPKIQPQAQDNINRNGSKRISTMSTNSISVTPSNHKLYRQSLQNFAPNNRKSLMEGLTNYTSGISYSINDFYSSTPASPVFLLKRNANNGHNHGTANGNNDPNERFITNLEYNKKIVQSELVSTTSHNDDTGLTSSYDKFASDIINENNNPLNKKMTNQQNNT